ncbi:MAG: hypothetical protein C0425_10495, partial [Chlorobiaceae bacterium]|nr:hypothetical protein [Chlorobiaceae bacterium]
FLESDGRIDYVTRSQAATLLIPSRQIGLTFRSKLFQNYLNFDFGIFNGNGAGATSNDNDEFMFVGRLSSDIFYVEGKNRNLNIGVNAASSRDSIITFVGDRVFYGGDFRFNYDRFLLSGEFNFFESEATNGAMRDDAAYYLSIGYMVTENLQLLAKYDSYNSITETPSIKNEINNNLYVFGANYTLNEFAKIFCNYIVNADRTDFKHHQLLVVTQILF